MEHFRVIAFTYKTLDLSVLGKLHLSPDDQAAVMGALKVASGIRELMYLSTCNRVELLVYSESEPDTNTLTEWLKIINSRLTDEELTLLTTQAVIYQGEAAITHVLNLVASLDSMVIGEREIITQFRKAYDQCNMAGLTGDFIRLLTRCAIETGKEVYTETDIAKNPVSVASLAYRQLRNAGMQNTARIVFVGSGETNTTLANYFKKHQFANFTVFNRTSVNGEKLAQTLNGQAFPLSDILNYKGGFDVLVVCTGSSEPVITSDIYKQLRGLETGRKIIIDLSVPANVAADVANLNDVHYIDVTSLRELAEANHEKRKGEIVKCETIIKRRVVEFEGMYRERSIELAFSDVPKRVKAIRETALNEVFAREIGNLNIESREVLEKVLTYMEKKYNAVAITTAKQVLLDDRTRFN